MEQFDAHVRRGNPFLRDSASNDAFRTSEEKKRPLVKWVVENGDQIQAVADSFHLLCMFRDKMSLNLSFGDGMYMDFLIRETDLTGREFSKVRCCCPMLL